MINGAELAEALKARLLSYMCSTLPVGNHESQTFLGQRLFEAWQRDLFKGPYFETIPPYVRLGSLADRFGEDITLPADKLFAERFRPKFSWSDVDHKFPAANRIRDILWQPDSREADLEKTTTSHQALWTRRLFKHQWDAFDRAIYENQNVVVATGTGSGKTECFQLPILYRLLTEPRNTRERRGVRALLVYPLNALVEDQSARLRRLLFWINLQFLQPGSHPSELITFGRYTGDTPVNEDDYRRQESAEALRRMGELVNREEMQASPPDILITNFTMLEYMLLREDDRQLFANPDLFSFIVLDEIHTYSGTQGMEVAMLLRRLRGFVERKSAKPLRVQCIGTSATLGGEAKKQADEFASTLFGSQFGTHNIVLGTRPPTKPTKFEAARWGAMLKLLNHERENDALTSLLQGEELSSDNDLWNKFAAALGVSSQVFQKNRHVSASERMGALFVESGLAEQLRSVVESQPDSCIDLDSLADITAGNAADPRTTAGQMLSLVTSSTLNHDPVLAIRTHLFVNEAKSGQVCLYPKCDPMPGGADDWWRQLYVSHHTSCENCNSRVYSALLCRRCGFVYLEGWYLRPILCSERDGAEKPENYERWLFRPSRPDLPGVADSIPERTGEPRTLCLRCGACFTARTDERFAITQDNHPCPKDRLLDIWAWRPEHLEHGKLESCLFCEQHWVTGKEVVTEPAPSTYAVSTLLLEELKRQFQKSSTASKIISFSDSRQQAAKLALRLQGTNRDFTFRQMVHNGVTDEGITTDDLLDELFDSSKDDPKLRRLMAADPARPPSNAELREQLATLLYREAVTAYLTLEAQGIARIYYDRVLFEAAKQLSAPSRILGRFSEKEKENWLTFLLDWGMRFVRYAMGPHRWGGYSLSYDTLKEWNVYPKKAAAFGTNDQGITGFLIRQRNKRNTVFNFASRLLRVGFRDSANLDIEELHAATRPFWDSILASPRLWAKDTMTANRPLLNFGGTDPERCLIQLNFSSLTWRRTRVENELFRCSHCGRLAFYSIRGICPIRDCSGCLQQVSHRAIDDNIFSPVRHYRRLVTTAAITPLRVEEHTAQISSQRRIAIEQEFKSPAEDSIDVVCGSTTFELGIDLGSIQSVFMSNLPPRAANYRQRAGRAGRRPGAQPFILNYVRQRPHDQYFWSAPQSFIAGPLPIPRLSISSEEVAFRHVAAIFIARLLELYRKQHPGLMQLAGPPAEKFVIFGLSGLTDIAITRELGPGQPLSDRLEHFLRGLDFGFDKLSCWAKLRARLEDLRRTYLSLHADDGCLDVLSDHGILPSYAFPIHVDEMRLRECPLKDTPRADLKLQRPRSIALREYRPGQTFVAGKYLILSEGLWEGYDRKTFSFCPKCLALDFGQSGAQICSKCQIPMELKLAVIPRAGFFGRVVGGAGELTEQEVSEMSDVYFDPAEIPPPQTKSVGPALKIDLLDARKMGRSRMRMFNPRPKHEGLLTTPARFSDAAFPHSPDATCLQRVSKGDGERIYLMHEFTTDILQIRFVDNAIGRHILESQPLQNDMRDNMAKREWLYDSVWLTIAASLSLSGAQILDIDSTEIAVVLRRTYEPGALTNREIILYDTTAGGAGYARELGDRISEVFAAALRRLTDCRCQDSCYACLRTYYNQLIHARLNRRYVTSGFESFVEGNFGR